MKDTLIFLSIFCTAALVIAIVGWISMWGFEGDLFLLIIPLLLWGGLAIYFYTNSSTKEDFIQMLKGSGCLLAIALLILILSVLFGD